MSSRNKLRHGVGALLTGSLLLLAATPASAQLRGGPRAAQPHPQPAFRAEDFVEFIGLNAAPDQKLSIEWNLTSEPNRFLGQARLQTATVSVEPYATHMRQVTLNQIE